MGKGQTIVTGEAYTGLEDAFEKRPGLWSPSGKRRGLLYNLKSNRSLLFLAMPGLLVILVFSYLPLPGLLIAFKDFRYDVGFWGSPWAGLRNFKFLIMQDAWRIIRNTVGYNLIFIALTMVTAVIIALMLYELSHKLLLKYLQTAFFLPYFLSWVVVGFTLFAFLNGQYGIVNNLLKASGLSPEQWYYQSKFWPIILPLVYLWKNIGYYSVIFYAALLSIEPDYYEAAAIDGASKLQMTRRISLPLLMPIISILVLLQVGRIFNADFGLFYNVPRDIGILYPVTDVIDTYVYRSLRAVGNISMASAAGLLQSVVGLLTVSLSNYAVRLRNPDNALY